MKIKLRLRPGVYRNCLGCPIHNGLLRKGIFSRVGTDTWMGMFLGIIPVWGNVSADLSYEAQKSKRVDTTKVFELTLYKKVA